MSGNDARYDADSAVLVAAKQKAALQEHAKMQWLACFDSALSAAEVGLERVAPCVCRWQPMGMADGMHWGVHGVPYRSDLLLP